MNIALILAGGAGLRISDEKPKQYMEINGKPMLIHTVSRFAMHPEIDRVFVVAAKEQTEYVKKLLDAHNCSVDDIIPGGSDRRESSYNGIMYLDGNFSPDDIVLIHDAARPNVSAQIISQNIKIAGEKSAAVTAYLSQDTLLSGDENKLVAGYVDRKKTYIVQTPQSFRLGIISTAHRQIQEKIDSGELDATQITDDSQLTFFSGIQTAIADGDKYNIKVTTQEDFGIICNIMK